MTFGTFVEYGLSYFLYGNMPFGGLLVCLALLAVCAGAAGYFLGCFNSAIVISNKKYGCDIRTLGSKNAGMTNMFRVFGKKAGFLTLAGDVGKAVLATVCGYAFLGYTGAWFAGLFCVIGHMFPFCFKFKGGKGVLVAAVVLLMTDWPVFLISVLIFAVVLIGSRMVSMASVMSALLMPLMVSFLYRMVYGDSAAGGLRLPIAVFIAFLVVFAHRDNLRRIRTKEEPKIRMPWEKKIVEGNEESGGRHKSKKDR